ncbi:MAG: nucleotidyl transferase AbiEii/AbiGii toxin family protein [Rhodospirillales bacterium]|nr:nucleotidyl transferase AbiEii/AbiGii toxin family protein [Rhodospirillales bacterium]
MISREEIRSVADETGLTPSVVEKDYVLGWLLAAVNASPVLARQWVFKGGTCLKKCYFETYRFSEDLDFTILDKEHLDSDFLTENFRRLAEWLYDKSGIVLPIDRFVFDIYDNPRGHKSCEGRVYYESHFASGKRSLPKIKFDLTADEILVMPAANRPVFHSYSDFQEEVFQVGCYDYPEVFGEKVRALGERGRPRDLYDVINLFRNDQLPASPVIRDVLSQKCAYKGIGIPVLADMESYREVLERNWEPMLAHQLPSLPSIEVYWEALPAFFDWLEHGLQEQAPVLGSVAGDEQIYRPLYGQLGLRSQSGASLEIIRFAAGNRLCVSLDYTDDSGRRSTRVIEPYSLRQASNGNVLLYAVRTADGQIRSYKIEQINDASMTNQVFAPRFQVELSPTGPVGPIEHLPRTGPRLGIPRRLPRQPRAQALKASGPTYIYRCPMCQKTFRKSRQDAQLNRHKTKEGRPCSGRTGYLEDVKY